MSISLAHCITQKNQFFTNAQPLGSRSPVLVHRHVHSTDLFSHCITHDNHLEFIISTLCSEEVNTSSSSLSHDDAPISMGIHTFTLCSSTSTPTQYIFFPTALHMRVIWSSSSQISAHRRLIHHLHRCLMTMHPALWEFTRSPCAQPQARPTLQISFLTALHRRIIWSSSQLSVRKRPSLLK